MGIFHRQMGLSHTGCRHRLSALSSAIVALSMAFPVMDAGAARFEKQQCRRVLLQDMDSGASVRGAESIVLSGDQARIFVSAYDRRARTKAGIPPQGGLYAIDLKQLGDQFADGPQRIMVRSVAAGVAIAGGFRPHGLALHETTDGTRTLAVINRRYFDKQPGKRSFRPSIELFRNSGTAWRHSGTLTHSDLCRANDLAFLEDTSLIATVDRSVCADFTVSEDVLGFAGGRLLQVDFDGDGSLTSAKPLATPLLAFPNGVVTDAVNASVHVAITKDAAIATFGRGDTLADGPASGIHRTSLPGHPDNLSLSHDGSSRKIIAALYIDLPRFAAYRYRWFGTERTASTIVAVDEAGAVETLFEDLDGDLFSAASSAVLVAGSESEANSASRGIMIAGSVGDEGLLVCGGKGVP